MTPLGLREELAGYTAAELVDLCVDYEARIDREVALRAEMEKALLDVLRFHVPGGRQICVCRICERARKPLRGRGSRVRTGRVVDVRVHEPPVHRELTERAWAHLVQHDWLRHFEE